jgi:regulator of protease activity HflC (stomatin/prohibitin superfamily)
MVINFFNAKRMNGARELNITLSVLLYLFVLVFAVLGSFGIISPSQRGIKITLGKTHEKVLQSGFYVKMPFITSVRKYDVRTLKEDFKTQFYTKDIQPADLEFSISYNLDPSHIIETYVQYGAGDEWKQKIIYQNVEQEIKNEFGHYDAVDIVNSRDKIATNILANIQNKLENYPVRMTAFQILSIDYSDAFEKVIEEKVAAAQEAEKAKNRTIQVQEEAKQKVLAAEGEARAMQIKNNALAQNRALIEYEIATRWDGKLPQVVGGGNMPMLNLQNLNK